MVRRVGRHPARLGQLVVPVDQELEDEDQQRDAGDLEEAPEVDPHAAAHEEHAEDDRRREPERDAQDGQQAAGGERQGGEEEHRLDPLAEDHQEGEEEEAGGRPSRRRSRARMRASDPFISPDTVRVAPHPDHQGGDHHRRAEVEDALERLLVDRHTVEQPGAGERSPPRPPRSRAQTAPQVALGPLLAQEGDDDADHQGGLDALAQGHDQGFKHAPLPAARRPGAPPAWPRRPRPQAICTAR